MFDRVLRQMREKVLASDYVVTFHARREMNDDELETYDIERAILTGKIRERQKDRATAEWKYVVHGSATDGRPVEVLAKISSTGTLAMITVYAL